MKRQFHVHKERIIKMTQQISKLDPSSYVTEEEKNDLLKKLKKIAKELFGISISIEEKNSEFGSTSCDVEGHSIKLCLAGADYNFEENESIRKNIDTFDYVTAETVNELPDLLTTFFHELSHLLTIKTYTEYFDCYRKWMRKYRNTDEAHRKYPYEKLADNLAFNLVAKNYDFILGVLLNKKVISDELIKKENLDMAKRYKEKYIIPEAFADLQD